MSTQYAQPLNCEARARTSSSSEASRVVCRDAASTAFIALLTCGTLRPTTRRALIVGYGTAGESTHPAALDALARTLRTLTAVRS